MLSIEPVEEEHAVEQHERVPQTSVPLVVRPRWRGRLLRNVVVVADHANASAWATAHCSKVDDLVVAYVERADREYRDRVSAAIDAAAPTRAPRSWRSSTSSRYRSSRTAAAAAPS